MGSAAQKARNILATFAQRGEPQFSHQSPQHVSQHTPQDNVVIELHAENTHSNSNSNSNSNSGGGSGNPRASPSGTATTNSRSGSGNSSSSALNRLNGGGSGRISHLSSRQASPEPSDIESSAEARQYLSPRNSVSLTPPHVQQSRSHNNAGSGTDSGSESESDTSSYGGGSRTRKSTSHQSHRSHHSSKEKSGSIKLQRKKTNAAAAAATAEPDAEQQNDNGDDEESEHSYFNWDSEGDTDEMTGGVSRTQTQKQRRRVEKQRIKEAQAKSQQGKIARLWQMHPILRAVVLGLTGGILFALPAIIILALDSDIHLFPDVDSKDQRYARQIVVKWFSYCAIMWVISIVLFNAIDAIPQLVMNVTKRRGRQPSETLKTHLSFFWKVRSYVKVALSSAFGLVFFIILFPNNGPFSSSTRQQWAQIVFQVISCVTILSILMCLEKLAIQRIAVNFHRTAYKDRLAKLKEGLRILDQLGKATANAPGTATADHLSRPGSPMRASSPSSQAQSQQQQNQQMHRRIGSEGSTISPGYDKMSMHGYFHDRMTGLGLGPGLPGAGAPAGGTQYADSMVSSLSPPRRGGRSLATSSSDPDLRKLASLSPGLTAANTVTGISSGDRAATAAGGSGGGFTSRFRKLKNKAVKTGGADVDIYSTEHGKRLARKLYYALAYRPPVPGAASPGLSAAPTAGDRSSTIAAATPYWLPETITIAEFRPYFDTEEEAEKAFAVFDRDGNGDISRREMRDAVLSIYKERKSLMTSLHDMSQVVGKLNRILVAFTLLVFLISALMVLGTDPLKSLASIGTIIIGWSFIFGTTFRTIFECIVFLFFTHPYDAGDTVMVAGDTYTVHKVRLLSTIFIKTDGMYTCYPNSVLASMMIRNFRRSPEQSESIYVHFDFTTPQHQLDEIKTRMTQFVLDHPRDYMDSIGFNVDMMENCNKLIMSIGLNYRSNWQSGAVRWERRTKFMFALRQSILEVGVRYHLPDQPVYHLNAPPPYSMVASHGTLSNNNGDGGGHDIHAGHDVSRYPSNMSLRTSASSASTMVYPVAPYQPPSATTVTGVTLAVPTASIAPYHHPLHQSPPPPLPQATIMVSQPSIGGMLSVANHQLDLQAPQSVTTSSAVSTASSTAVSASAAPSIVSTAGTTTQRRKQKHPLQQVQFAKDPDSIAGASSSSSGPSTSSSSNANSVAQPSTAAAMAAFSSGMSSLAD